MKNLRIYLLTATLFIALGCSKDDDDTGNPGTASPTAAFVVSNAAPSVDEQLTFTNNSQNAAAYEWDFGDGNMSSAKSPSHSYTDAGSYTVKLTATGEGGSDSTTKTIDVSNLNPIADFTISNAVAETGETITFINTSLNTTSYQWDFGDGNFSTDEHPTHVYSDDDTYSITLTATGDGGEDTVVKTIVIEANYDGDWTGSTIEGSSDLNYANVSFSVDGNAVSISTWNVSTSFGLFFGSNWSAALSSNNSFTFTPEVGNLTFNYSISLESSTSGSGVFTYNGQNYDMNVTR